VLNIYIYIRRNSGALTFDRFQQTVCRKKTDSTSGT
jgi:hypothetical protein